MTMFNPSHPGPILKEALAAIPMSVTKFAAHIGVSRVSLSRVLNGHAGVSADMSIKIGEAFKQPPDIWFNVQNQHDIWRASQAKRKKIRPVKFTSDDLAA